MRPLTREVWPELRLAAWQDTYATVHRWTQLLGKTRLALAPMENHWWQTALYVSPCGLRTSPIPYGDRTFELELDFHAHRLVATTSERVTVTQPLGPRSVADFYRDYMRLLRSLDIDAPITPMPQEIPDAVPFTEDHAHRAYDPDAMLRCFEIVRQSARVMKEFRGRYVGKASPVQFWWGAFDLAYTRFSGRRAPPHPSIPGVPDLVTREGYSHECASIGWWPGGAGQEAAFYAYCYPEPPGYAQATVGPETAYYDDALREWLLPYDAVRAAGDPDGDLLRFFESTYAAAATLGRWDRAALERTIPGGLDEADMEAVQSAAHDRPAAG